MTCKFAVQKNDEFRYKDRSSKSYKRNYQIEITRSDDTTFEAYYPKSILYPIKVFNIFDREIYESPSNTARTLYYDVDSDWAYSQLLNAKETVKAIKTNSAELIKIVEDEEAAEDLANRIDLVLESEEKLNKYLLEDIINIHFNYGLNVEDGHYFDLKRESRFRKLVLKLFGKSRFVLNKVHFMRHEVDEGYITIEFLKGQENLSSGRKIDWSVIEESFCNGDFLFSDHKNITLTLERFVYTEADGLLLDYRQERKIDTPNMNKDIINSIRRITI